jgi:hypothetical protein
LSDNYSLRATTTKLEGLVNILNGVTITLFPATDGGGRAWYPTPAASLRNRHVVEPVPERSEGSP